MSWSSFMEEGARRRTGTFATIVPAIVVFCLLSALSATAGTTATGVLGQTDFTHNRTNNVSARGLSISEEFFFFFGSAAAIAVDQSTFPNGLYVADTGNNRVLGYVSVSALTNGQAADVVIGPSDFESSSPSTFEIPEGVAVDASGNLYVADTDNNRVLIFHSPLAAKASTGQTTGFRPFMVLGQGGDFNATDCNLAGSDPDAETLCEPTGLALDSSGDLYVSDTGNDRVLEYNNPVGTGTLAASIVFGQGGNFTTDSGNSTSPDHTFRSNRPGGRYGWKSLHCGYRQ